MSKTIKELNAELTKLKKKLAEAKSSNDESLVKELEQLRNELRIEKSLVRSQELQLKAQQVAESESLERKGDFVANKFSENVAHIFTALVNSGAIVVYDGDKISQVVYEVALSNKKGYLEHKSGNGGGVKAYNFDSLVTTKTTS